MAWQIKRYAYLLLIAILIISCNNNSSMEVPLIFNEYPREIRTIDSSYMPELVEVKIAEEYDGKLMASPSEPVRKLVEKDGYASCSVYEVQDENNQPITLPISVKNELDCPVVASISPDYKFLIYGYTDELHCYNFTEDKVFSLVIFTESNEGISAPLWSPDKKRFMFVSVNQEKYPENCRIFVLELNEDGSLKQKFRYDAFVHYVCGNVCGSSAGSDYWFENNHVIAYRKHEMAPENPGKKVIIRFTDL